MMTASKPSLLSDEDRYSAVKRRDRAADGLFVYAVRTTGVYCRPSCAARTALKKNVVFFPGTKEAERAGYRACKRCLPASATLEELQTAKIAEVCQWLATADEVPALNDVAQRCGMSRFHFQRLFKRITGLTPGQFHVGSRMERLRKRLKGKRSVSQAILDSGFTTCGQFYSQSPHFFGMKPKRYQSGGHNEHIRYGVGDSRLGKVLVAATCQGVCAILLGDDASSLLEDLRKRFDQAIIEPSDSAFQRTVKAVILHVDDSTGPFTLPMDLHGTVFQQRVWQQLMKIPAGQTATYREIASRIGKPEAVRAVAGACAANALAVVVPCHRVVRSDGSLSGYRWGTKRKAALLAAECKERD